jgi:PLP dependent protein
MSTISASLQAIQANIIATTSNAGRLDEVQLLAVSKAQPAEKVREAYLAGQTRFGENYVQEAIEKQALLPDCNIEWHFIGPIQSNKTTLIAEHFSWVHSVDRLKIAERLSSSRPANLAPLNVCIQINSSEEITKSGADIASLSTLVSAIVNLPKLRLRGLMAIPAPVIGLAKQRAQFRIVRDAFMKLQQDGFTLDTLSIGMSDDYIAAIWEGSTMVRIGSAIFGTRQRKEQLR